MFRKALTHLIILALTVLPVQVISAGVENSNMQMSMQQKQASNDCMHGQSSEQTSEKMTPGMGEAAPPPKALDSRPALARGWAKITLALERARPALTAEGGQDWVLRHASLFSVRVCVFIVPNFRTGPFFTNPFKICN